MAGTVFPSITSRVATTTSVPASSPRRASARSAANRRPERGRYRGGLENRARPWSMRCSRSSRDTLGSTASGYSIGSRRRASALAVHPGSKRSSSIVRQTTMKREAHRTSEMRWRTFHRHHRTESERRREVLSSVETVLLRRWQSVAVALEYVDEDNFRRRLRENVGLPRIGAGALRAFESEPFLRTGLRTRAHSLSEARRIASISSDFAAA